MSGLEYGRMPPASLYNIRLERTPEPVVLSYFIIIMLLCRSVVEYNFISILNGKFLCFLHSQLIKNIPYELLLTNIVFMHATKIDRK